MAAGGNKKISAASARAHTRRPNKSNAYKIPQGMLRTALAVLFMGFLSWAFQAFRPPPPKKCGSPDGPPITAPRIKLRDRRYLAYKEHGVSRDIAKYKFIHVHGFDSGRHDAAVADTLSWDIVEDLGIYIVSFDRPGYGESDPDTKGTIKSIALDMEELADQLELGSKFYIIGFSMGGNAVWSCLKYIPHRLAGAVMLAPAVNYWWDGFPANLSSEVFNEIKVQDQWTLRVAHYVPWLTYWWNTQKWFPSSSAIAQNLDILSRQDLEIIASFAQKRSPMAKVRQQGDYYSLHLDMNINFGNWEFSPVYLENPFPTNEAAVHIWQGDEDRLVSVKLQRFIAERHPWIHYHEISGAGHLFPLAVGRSNAIIKSLLVEE